MIDSCKNYLVQPTCLLRQLAEGTAGEETNNCEHCEATIGELDQQDDLLRRVAGEPTTSSAAIEAEGGYQRAGQLARNLWPATNGNASGGSSKCGSGGLRVRCPSCGSLVQYPDDKSSVQIECESCHESFQLVDEFALEQTLLSRARTIGHFQLLEQVGSGSFGVVWRAKDTQLDRTVAIKIPRRQQLTEREIEEFVDEARASAQLKHPNIVSVHEIGRDNGSVFIVSDFVKGFSLGDYLTDRVLTAKEAATMGVTIADALHHAHEQEVVHRDLKPGNIALDSDLKPYIMDFGLALRGSPEMTMTSDGKILGTPAYMSPEQARGDSNSADRRSDIYSLGVVLFEMLTGERPFRGNLRMLIHQISNEEPPNPQRLNGAVPRDMATICLRCLQKSPDRRYQTATELKADLTNFLEGRPIAARPVGPIERLWLWSRNRKALAASLAALTLLLVAGAVASMIAAFYYSDLADKNLRLAEKNDRKTKEAQSARDLADKKGSLEKIAADRSKESLNIFTGAFLSTRPQNFPDLEMSAVDVLHQAKSSLQESNLDQVGRIEILAALSNAFSELAEMDAAVETAREAMKLKKQHSGSDDLTFQQLRRVLAQALLNSADPLGALTEIDDVLDAYKTLAPDEEALASAVRFKVRTHLDLEQSEEASATIEAYFDSILSVRHWAQVQFEMTVHYLDHEQMDAATESFQKFTQLSANEVLGPRAQQNSLLVEGLLLAGQGEIAKATLLADIIVLEPPEVGFKFENSSEYTRLALLYWKIGRRSEAIQLSEECIDLLPPNSFARDPGSSGQLMTNLAKMYRAKGDFRLYEQLVKRHLEETERFFGRDHSLSQILVANLGSYYRQVKDYENAIKYLREAHEASKSYPILWWTNRELWWAYHNTGQYERCLELMEQERRPDNEPLDWQDEFATRCITCGALSIKNDELEKAEAYLKEGYEIRLITRRQGWSVANTQSLIGDVMMRQGKVDGVKNMLTEGFRELRKYADDIPAVVRGTRLQEAVDRLIKFSELEGDSDAVEKWQAEKKQLMPEFKDE